MMVKKRDKRRGSFQTVM